MKGSGREMVTSLLSLLRLRLLATLPERAAGVTRAKRQETRDRRLAQMLEELERGDKYMKMDYRPKRGMQGVG